MFLAGFLLLGLVSCTRHRAPESLALSAKHSYSDQAYRRVLSEHVSEDGLVDYTSLQQSPGHLGEYYRQVARYSPDSHPALFPNEQDRLAYWINAYNATVMWNVLQHYPISSVKEVDEPLLLGFLPDLAGFFLFQRFTYGAEETNLYYLEKRVILKRFDDPRVHFALNCASRGCPRLPTKPFTGTKLDEELNREAHLFINDPKYVRIEPAKNRIYLSSIFKWYEKDFTLWLEKEYPRGEISLLEYIKNYSKADRLRAIEELGEDPEVHFLPYDWGLNDH